MGILGNMFGMDDEGSSDFGARLALASQALMAMDQGQQANIGPSIAALNAQRRKLADEAKTNKWLQSRAAALADTNPKMAEFLSGAPPEVGSSLIVDYYKTLLQPPEWKTFESGGDVMRYNPNDPNSKPELFYDGPAQAPTGEMAQYENDQAMRVAQGLPRQSFADWNVSTLAPPKPADWENKYSALVADMQRRGIPEDQIPTLSEFLDDGLKITTNPDGTTTVSQGGTGNKAPTEGDYRAKQIVASISGDIPEAIGGFDLMTPYAGTLEGIGANALNDEDSQAAIDAIRNVATQAVYAISGAGTTENEMKNKVASMVPSVGDKGKTLRNKKRRLIDTIKSMTTRAGITPEELGFDPAIFEVGDGTTAPPPASGGTPKKMIWTPGGGLREEN